MSEISDTMTDSKYFTTTKKGEIFELRADLNSERKEKKKDAVKKVLQHFIGKFQISTKVKK